MQSDQEAADEDQIGAVGAAVVSDQAATVGVTAVPTPITDKDSDMWFLHQYFASSFTFVTAAGFSEQLKRYDFDSKAMRKVPEGTTISWMVENASATFGIEYYLQFAVLLKLA